MSGAPAKLVLAVVNDDSDGAHGDAEDEGVDYGEEDEVASEVGGGWRCWQEDFEWGMRLPSRRVRSKWYLFWVGERASCCRCFGGTQGAGGVRRA